MNLPIPCNMYCINPFKALTEGLGNGYEMRVKSTLWEGDNCEFEVISESKFI